MSMFNYAFEYGRPLMISPYVPVVRTQFYPKKPSMIWPITVCEAALWQVWDKFYVILSFI